MSSTQDTAVAEGPPAKPVFLYIVRWLSRDFHHKRIGQDDLFAVVSPHRQFQHASLCES